MSMYAPLIRHIVDSGDVFIERVLPVTGQLTVTKDSKVEPYGPLGECSFSQKCFRLPKNFKTKKTTSEHKFFYAGMLLGKIGTKKVFAPFNGHLIAYPDNRYEFAQLESKFILLSGVWGEVYDLVKANSVLLKTQTRDLLFAAATHSFFSGELIVFPNPSALLEKHYLGKFATGSTEGKIVYVGNFLSMTLLKDAEKLGWGAVLAGSTNKDTFEYAKSKNISLGIFAGFGQAPTPENVFKFLNDVSNRYVFFDGSINRLRVPLPFEEHQKVSKVPPKNSVALVKKGASVFCLQKPYFGQIGIVDSMLEFSIFVKFSSNSSLVEIRCPNFYLMS